MNELLFLEYEQFARQVFAYLKRNLLSHFPEMKLEFSYDTDTAVARNFFNKIVVFPKNVHEIGEGNIIKAKNTIIYVMIHEAFHQSQTYDARKYNSNFQYMNFIEQNVDYSAMSFIDRYNQELADEFKLPIYIPDINVLKEMYTQDNIVVPVTMDNNDIVYLHSLLNFYIVISTIDSYNYFYKNENIIFDFIMNNEKSIDRVTVKYNCVLDYDKINYIIRNYMYQGIHDTIYKAIISQNDDHMVVSIYLSNEKLPAMRKILIK